MSNNRPFKELSDKFIKNCQNIASKARDIEKTPEVFNRGVDSMLYNLHNYLDRHNGKIDDIKDRASSSEAEWQRDLSKLKSDYKLVHTLYNRILDEERSIHRIENRSHVRALVYRFLTTLGIGFGIMIVYFVAQALEIAMPLLKIPV